MKENLFIIPNKNFKTITIRVAYLVDNKEEDIGNVNLLPSLITKTNNKYKTVSEFNKARIKNYIQDFSCAFYPRLYPASFIIFDMIIPSPKVIKENILNKSVNFFLDTLYNPNIDEYGFNKEEFDNAKNTVLTVIKKNMSNISNISINKTREEMDDIGYFKNNIYNHIEQINNSTPKSLYEYYLKVIKNNNPIFFVMGDVEESEIRNILNDYITKLNIPTSYDMFLESQREMPKEITIKESYNQTSVVLGFIVKNMKLEDKKYFNMAYSLLFHASSRIVMDRLREYNDLVYSSQGYSFINNGAILIEASINKVNINKTIEQIKLSIEDLKNEKLIKENMSKIAKGYKIKIERIKDNRREYINEKFEEKVGISNSIEDKYKEYMNITPKEISEFASRLILDCVYVVEGDKNE